MTDDKAENAGLKTPCKKTSYSDNDSGLDRLLENAGLKTPCKKTSYSDNDSVLDCLLENAKRHEDLQKFAEKFAD